MARIGTDTTPQPTPGVSARAGAFALSESDRERLSARLQLAVKRARRSGRQTLAALTLPLPADLDPSAVVCASRRPGEPWFLLEQPERGARALAALGEAVSLTATGPERFATVADRWRALAAAAVSDPPEDPSDTGSAAGGPIALGGFAFAAEGGADLAWSGFAPASLIVPEVTVTRERPPGHRPGGASPTPGTDPRAATDGTRVRMTLSALAAPDDTAEQLLARLERRVGELRVEPLALLDPAPTGRYRIASAMPPEHYEAAVARAVELIRAGQLEKVVLAREVQVHAGGGPPTPIRPRCSECCARASPRARSSAWGATTPRSSPPVPSCWCAARVTA